MAITLKKARRTLIATAVLWAMGAGVAGATGNTLKGPVVTGGSSTAVKILQVGTGNVISDTGETTGGAFVVNAGSGKVTLTIQQVGTAGTSGGNTLALAAYTNNADATIKVFQGGSKTAGDPGDTEAPTSTPAVSNTATVNIGAATKLAGAITLNLQQQSSYNTATVNFGTITTGAAGTLNLVQKGAASVASEGNTASLTIDGATANTYALTQDGKSNQATVTASGMLGDLTVTQTGTGHDAQTDHDGAGGMSGGIHMGSINGFDLTVTGNNNKIQVDLTNASTSSEVSGLSFTGSGKTLSIYGGAVGSPGTVAVDTVTASGDLSVSATGGSISLTRLDLGGDSSFSTTTGGSISLTDINVSAGKSLTVSAGTSTISLSGLTLTGNSTFSTDPTVGSSFSMSVGQNQTKTVNVGLNAFSLATGAVSGTSVTVEQKGLGGKTFSMTNSTANATIQISQTGDVAHSATGIEFNAASGSTFSLTQR